MFLHRNRRRGIAHIWAALVIMMLIALAGLATDMAYLYFCAQQLQVTADASALAAGRHIRGDLDEGRVAAHEISMANRVAISQAELDLNYGNYPGGDIVFGRYDRELGEFTPQLSDVNAVEINARRTETSFSGPLPLTFGSIFGVPTADLSRRAIAMVGGGTGAGIIALNREASPGLYIHGDLTLSVTGGDIQVNSDNASNATRLQGSFTLDAEDVNSVGGINTVGKSGDFGETQLHTDAHPIDDPLAWLEPPSMPFPDLGTVSGSNDQLIAPGYYSGGISRTGGTLTMQPGIYYLDGAGFDVGGNANVWGEGVMIYVDNNTDKYAIDLGGTGSVHLRPPDSGYYEGITFFQARDNDSASRIIGGAGTDVEGTIYIPGGLLEISGTSSALGNQLIADRLDISGNGVLTINYDGRFPAPGNIVFLVR